MGCCCSKNRTPPHTHLIEQTTVLVGPNPSRPLYDADGDAVSPVTGRKRPSTYDLPIDNWTGEILHPAAQET